MIFNSASHQLDLPPASNKAGQRGAACQCLANEKTEPVDAIALLLLWEMIKFQLKRDLRRLFTVKQNSQQRESYFILAPDRHNK